MLLEVEEIQEIAKQAVLLGLQNKREQLLFGVNAEYVAGLRLLASPADQVLADLQQMAVDGPVLLGVPLERWLRNAAYAVSLRPEKQKFFREMADKAASAAKFGGAPPPPPVHPERILFDSDLLPFGFLAGAARAGRAVARAIVRRHAGAEPQFWPSGNPALSFGTGWLIGPRHVITNHHVIDARTENELPASPEEFAAQAQSAEFQFDYDSEDAAGEKLAVAALTANDAQLDYAVFELGSAPTDRAPIPIWTRPLDFNGDMRLPVNIIQHPGGNSKQIALRNNLAAALEGGELRYFTDTAPGSSGSPVCNDMWQALALHRASTRNYGKYDYQGKSTIWINFGPLLSRVVDDLKAKNKWAEIGAVVV